MAKICDKCQGPNARTFIVQTSVDNLVTWGHLSVEEINCVPVGVSKVVDQDLCYTCWHLIKNLIYLAVTLSPEKLKKLHEDFS